MPTLNGSMPYHPGPERPCLWCSQPTDVTFVPEFQRELGPQPMHMLCGVLLIRAYERWKRGQALEAGTAARLLAIHGSGSQQQDERDVIIPRLSGARHHDA